MSREETARATDRVNSDLSSEFFRKFVYRYPDKQYQSWLGRHFTKVGIDYSYDSALLDKVAAAIIDHYTDTSYSTALRHAGHKERRNEIPRFEQLFDRVESNFFVTTEAFLEAKRPDLSHEHSPLVNADIFLLRLLGSLRAARYLINFGFFLEPLTLLRSSLEQLAWCHLVGTTFDTRQIDNPTPSKCIREFKTRFEAAGLLYGVLSTYSHFEFDAQKHFVASIDGLPGIISRSTEFKFFSLLLYAFMFVAVQYTCRDFSRFYKSHYGLELSLRNVVLPTKHLVGHALLQPELDDDEIASMITQIYFLVFSDRK